MLNNKVKGYIDKKIPNWLKSNPDYRDYMMNEFGDNLVKEKMGCQYVGNSCCLLFAAYYDRNADGSIVRIVRHYYAYREFNYTKYPHLAEWQVVDHWSQF